MINPKQTGATATASHGAAEPRDVSTPTAFLTVTQIVKHTEPCYPAQDGGLYGEAMDKYIRQLYKDNPEMIIQNLALEISDDAAFALRDRCNRGEY